MVAPYVVAAGAAYAIYYLSRGSVEAAQGRGNTQRVTYEMVLPDSPFITTKELVELGSKIDKVVISNNNLPPHREDAKHGVWATFNTVNAKVTTGHKDLYKEWHTITVDPKTGKRVWPPGPKGTYEEWKAYNDLHMRDINEDGIYDESYYDNRRIVRQPTANDTILTVKLAWHQGEGTPPYDAKGNSVKYIVSEYLTNLNSNPAEYQEGYQSEISHRYSTVMYNNPPYFHFYDKDDNLLMSADILEHDYDPAVYDSYMPKENIIYPSTGKEPMMIQTIKKNHFRFPIKAVWNLR